MYECMKRSTKGDVIFHFLLENVHDEAFAPNKSGPKFIRGCFNKFFREKGHPHPGIYNNELVIVNETIATALAWNKKPKNCEHPCCIARGYPHRFIAFTGLYKSKNFMIQ